MARTYFERSLFMITEPCYQDGFYNRIVMNRRLITLDEITHSKRYKTADTRISVSRKLPKDFFPRKSASTPPAHLHKRHKASLPCISSNPDKNNSQQFEGKALGEKDLNFEITFRPTPKNDKWKLPTLNDGGKKTEAEKIKRMSRIRVQGDLKFDSNMKN